ncbi:DNA repair protein RecO [Sphingomonas sp. FW199]|uniref:DNA repair protein RecO n=1 Tax=Sphingomonas sp. FW199 TaxID=3400217 RepID=UPI003CEB610F
MHLIAPATILSVRLHGEHGAIVRGLTEEAGVVAGYVRGGHSRRLRPILQPGNRIAGEWRARTEDQLPGMTAELIHSRAPLFAEPLPAAAIDWATALTAATLPEGQPYPRLHATLEALLTAIEAAPAARGWAAALVRYELLVLGELGFGLDLRQCVATGTTEDLTHVSPKSGGAVSAAAAQGLTDRLLRLPRFLLDGSAADWPDILDGLRLTGHFIARDLMIGRGQDAIAARDRLVDRIKRAVA